MSVVVVEFGALTVMAKYIFQKGGSGPWYFRRRLPDDVREHYPAKKNGYLIFSLQTKHAAKAAKLGLYRAWETHAERLCGVIQRQAPGRMLE